MSAHPRTTVSAARWVLLGSLLATGCAGDVDSATRLQALSSEYSRFSRSDAAKVLWASVQDQIGTCLAADGFDYFPPADPPLPGSVATPSQHSLFPIDATIVDGWLEVLGRDDQRAPDDAAGEAAYLATLSGVDQARYQGLLDPDDPTSCQAAAATALGEDFLVMSSMLEGLPARVADETASSDSVRVARAQVIECAGFVGTAVAGPPELGFEAFAEQVLFGRVTDLLPPEATATDITDLAPFAADLLPAVDEFRQAESDLRTKLRRCGETGNYADIVGEEWTSRLRSTSNEYADTVGRMESLVGDLAHGRVAK